MEKLSRPGRYVGRLRKSGLGKTRSGCLQFIADCEVYLLWDDTKQEFLPCPVQSIRAYIILTCKDGSRNNMQYSVLNDALDWDGESLEYLQETDFSERDVGIHVNENEYQGNFKVQVDFISEKEWTRGIQKVEGKKLANMQNAWLNSTAEHPKGVKTRPQDPDDLGLDEDIPY